MMRRIVDVLQGAIANRAATMTGRTPERGPIA
jgi:hypothetical protein